MSPEDHASMLTMRPLLAPLAINTAKLTEDQLIALETAQEAFDLAVSEFEADPSSSTKWLMDVRWAELEVAQREQVSA